MRTWRLSALAAVVLGAGAGSWYFLQPQAAHPSTPEPPGSAIPVTAGTARVQDVPIYAAGIGTVQAISTVNVTSRVDGAIVRTFFKPGQEVAKDDPLFEIDPRPFQAALDQAQANAAKDEAQLLGAQRDLDRYGKLVGSGFQTRQSFEDQQATVAQLKASVQADNAAVETARLNLGFTTIRAPVAGRAGARLVDPGNEVQASAAAQLVSIVQIKPIYATFTLPAVNLDAIRQGDAKQALEVDVFAADGKTLLAKGTLSFIDNHVDTSTGTIALKGTFTNADEKLWPGEFINAQLIIATRHNAVTVPIQTVMAGSDGDYVYVIGPDDRVTRRKVQVAARQDGIAVIAKGLSAGDHVVVEGQYRLADNIKVRVEADGVPAPSGGPAG